jgi:pimeloyl-ACP methyl ester carboxylesterase
MTIPTLEGITAEIISTERLRTRVLFSGPQDGTPVLFVHGNISSATYWEEVMLALPEGYRGIAPDQRGYGDADPEAKIDATRGMADLSDDLVALLDYLQIERAHVVGHSLGGAVVWQLMADAPERLLPVTQVAPSAPFGVGGTKDEQGTPCYTDYAGSGAGLVNPQLVEGIKNNDRGSEGLLAPRNVLNAAVWKPPFRPAREEALLSALLATHIGPHDYPGDAVSSENWPGFAPGYNGPNNAISPKYAVNLDHLLHIEHKPPVLWVRGADDIIVSDTAAGDLAVLGAAGVIPGWPGMDVYPPQPMLSQTRYVLESYVHHGGTYKEVVIDDAGHSPYLEKPDEFNAVFHHHIGAS